ncbi:MAG: hypothetical protein ACTSPB_07565 [Candidatus Thorarchaeota archaeon]
MSTPDLRDDPNLMKVLGVLTGDLLPVRRTTTTIVEGKPVTVKGRYFLNEDDLSDLLKTLLHGRAFVIDKESVTETSSSSPVTYYISADKTHGLLVPGRSLSINVEGGNAHYRWTDDGEKWTNWVTLPDGATDSYLPQEMNRFAEIQAYVDKAGTLVSMRVTR